MEVRCPHCMELFDDEYELCPHCGFILGTKPKELYHLHPGMMLNDRYMVGTVVGFGGFGIVYRAWDTKLDIMVCIKEYFPAAIVTRTPGTKRVIPLGRSNKLEEYKRNLELFIDEAKNTAKFNTHPNIVNIFNYFEENGTAYMVMEFMEGETLKDFLKDNGGTIDVDTAVDILMSVISALKEVHKQKMLHRDISPDNIFICSNNKVKLIDFGAAKFSDDEKEKTREIVLKPGYAPPEQYQSKSVQAPWTDIYALGATLYRAITGVVPQESTNRVEEDLLKNPKEYDANIPDYIDSALMRAMSVTPEFRFRSVQEFEDAIVGKKIMRSEKQQRRFLLIRRLITVGVALTIISIAAGITYKRMRDKQRLAELSECTISMWMPYSDEEGAYDNAQRLVRGLTSEFERDYEQVTIEVAYIPESEYSSLLADALQKGEGPTVFCSQYLTEETKQYATNLKDIMKLISGDAYYYLADYETYYPERDCLPIGLEFDLEYRNIKLYAEGDTNPSSDLEAFLLQEAGCYIGSVSDYRSIQMTIPGYYVVDMPSAGLPTATFIWEWSVNNEASAKCKNAGKRLLYYFLGENAQDVMFVQNANGLPLNRIMMDVYLEVNSELEFIEEKMNEITVEM